jgi:hypothetical protein
MWSAACLAIPFLESNFRPISHQAINRAQDASGNSGKLSAFPVAQKIGIEPVPKAGS